MSSFNQYRFRRVILALIIMSLFAGYGIFVGLQEQRQIVAHNAALQRQTTITEDTSTLAMHALGELLVKGRAAKTGYTRDMFGQGWRKTGNCTMRELILIRDLQNTRIDNCKVLSGVLRDPYTNTTIQFMRGPETSDDVQIDHVVALSDAWQKGAQQLTSVEREALANDPLELLAVEGEANQEKGDGDAATWLPANTSYRCKYVARQIAVKQKYRLWVTSAEKQAMKRVLGACPAQTLPYVKL